MPNQIKKFTDKEIRDTACEIIYLALEGLAGDSDENRKQWYQEQIQIAQKAMFETQRKGETNGMDQCEG